jgi:class 3 adenylate cyclase
MYPSNRDKNSNISKLWLLVTVIMPEILIYLFIAIAIAALSFFGGIWYQRKHKPHSLTGGRIEEYPFYPFTKNQDGHIEFSPELFNQAVQYFLSKKDQRAAQQLIIIGEQNLVRDTLGSLELNLYKKLYHQYNGDRIIDDNNQFLENFKRIVHLIGRSFPDTGFEILLHNLVNPSKSIVAIEQGEVTGRRIENGTTNLVLDLKTRKERNQDKLNYELNIGSRKFKCTTIPIFRQDFGLVGAICINIDVNFIKDNVASDAARIETFISNFLKTDFELDENILSRDEYTKALAGKRHYLDNPILQELQHQEKREILAIMFSDIVNYTRLMGDNEKLALETLQHNRKIHIESIRKYNGKLLKEMGDGILASFKSVFDAVKCAVLLQQSTADDYQLRIGIHMGEVISSGKDVIGDGVNIASRIQMEADPGGVVISDSIYQNIKNRLELDTTVMDDRQLKNVEANIKLYQFRP